MNLEEASWQDLRNILRETHSIWSAGLDKSNYYEHIWAQLNHNWGRKNINYLVLKNKDSVVSSCKFYQLELQSRSKIYRLAGIGAMHTKHQYQGMGYATKLINAIIKVAVKKDYDGLVLFSDIDPAFYERLGFELLRHNNFVLDLNKFLNNIDPIKESASIQSLRTQDIEMIMRHYIRWLPNQTYGFKRTHDYLDFKIRKENYLHKHSKLQWPCLEIITNDSGYALVEQADKTMRVLEVVSRQNIKHSLWMHLLDIAKNRGIKTIRGWEHMAPEFPYKLDNRDWGIPMMYFINKSIKHLCKITPSNLLELDHL